MKKQTNTQTHAETNEQKWGKTEKISRKAVLTHEQTNEQTHAQTNEQTHAQTNERTNAQTNKQKWG